ncbi:MAG: butyrate kinase [Bacteroidota bacterium]
MKVLAINPGSTSTKIAVYENFKLFFLKNIKHSTEELGKFKKISDQFEFRKNIILDELIEAKIDIESIDAVVGRGGLVKPIKSGVYEVNDALKRDLIAGMQGEHASNLGGLIASDIASMREELKAYIADPVVVDELDDIARISGHPNFVRVSIFHALNQKAIAKTHARFLGQKYEEMNLIVAHLGGGISVSAHRKGRVVDTNQALDGDGPFSPERSGTLPVGQLVKTCFSGKYTEVEVMDMIRGKGGLTAYLGTNNASEVEDRIKNGDEEARKIYKAMSYQISKCIGEMATVLKGEIHGILITGGIAYDENFISWIRERVHFIAPVYVYPGEDEMKSLAMNGMMVLNGQIKPEIYI